MKKTSWLWVMVLVAAGVCTSSCVSRLRLVPVRPVKAAVPEMVRQSAAGQGEAAVPAVAAVPPPSRQERPASELAAAKAGRAVLDRRLRFYQERLAGWQAAEGLLTALGLSERPAEWGRCLAEVGELYDQYERLQQQVGADAPEQADVAPGVGAGELLDRDLGYLGSGCDAVLALGTAACAGRPADEDLGVGERSGTQPAGPLPLEVRRQFGLALLRGGQFEAAAHVLASGGVSEQSGSEEMASQRMAADLLLAVGRVAEARNHYERLGRYCRDLQGVDRWAADQLALLQETDLQSDAFSVYLGVLRDYLGFDGQQVPDEMRQGVARLEAQAPLSGLAKRGRQLLEMVEAELGDWLPARLAEVDRLVEAREFAGALAIMEGLMAREDLDPAQQAMVRETLVKAQKAKFLAEQTQQATSEQEADMQWEKGVQFLESRSYDEAIAIFTALLETGYQAEASEKLGEASDLAIKEIRGQASTLFVQARQTNNLDRKKSLLMESWQLLHGVEARYPAATPAMREKVRQNLSYLEDYIRQVDPALLDASLPSGGQDVEEVRP